MAIIINGPVTVDRISGLTEKTTGFSGYNFIIDKASDSQSFFASFDNLFATASHNDLSGLQGGQSGQYYHLTAAQHTIAIATKSRIESIDTLNFLDFEAVGEEGHAFLKLNTAKEFKISDGTTEVFTIDRAGKVDFDNEETGELSILKKEDGNGKGFYFLSNTSTGGFRPYYRFDFEGGNSILYGKTSTAKVRAIFGEEITFNNFNTFRDNEQSAYFRDGITLHDIDNNTVSQLFSVVDASSHLADGGGIKCDQFAATFKTDFYLGTNTTAASTHDGSGVNYFVRLDHDQYLNVDGDINITTGQAYEVNLTQVLTDQQTGVAPMTNLTAPANLDADTVTVAELADIVGNLINKLRTHGMVTT